MIEIGNLLKKARQERQISLEELSKELKIQKRHLQAMEDGDFSVFAGEVYVRGALRNYAEAVGLNQEEIVSFYDQFLKLQSIDRTIVFDLNQKKKEGNKPRFKKAKRTKRPLPFVVLIWFALLLFIVGGSIWYRCQQASEENKTGNIPETNYTQGEKDSDPENITPTENNLPVDSSNMPPAGKPDPVPELNLLSNDNKKFIYVLNGVKNADILLEFTGRCWVSVKYEGQLQQEITKNYEAGNKLYLKDSIETEICLGNPSVVKVTVNELEPDDFKGLNNVIYIIIRKGN